MRSSLQLVVGITAVLLHCGEAACAGDAPARLVAAPLPLMLYRGGHDVGHAYFTPTGRLGQRDGVTVDEHWPADHGSCIRIAFDRKEGWAGVVWEYPGTTQGLSSVGVDLRGARWLTFRARGERGGEGVEFKTGIYQADPPRVGPFPATTGRITLGADWHTYRIDLTYCDLRSLVAGFACVWAAQGQPLAFYLDDIRYE